MGKNIFYFDYYNSIIQLFHYREESPSPAPEAGPSTSAGETTVVHTAEPKPVERSVEFRNTDDAMASMVRCLYFADTFIVNGKFCHRFQSLVFNLHKTFSCAQCDRYLHIIYLDCIRLRQS